MYGDILWGRGSKEDYFTHFVDRLKRFIKHRNFQS